MYVFHAVFRRYLADHAARIARDERAFRHVAYHDASCRDDGIGANRDTAYYLHPAADPHVVADRHGERILQPADAFGDVNPALSRNDLFKSGMNIGRDMVGTMTNTLILAFLGSEFALIIFLYSRGLTFNHLFSTAFVALQTISGLSSSIGMVLAIPLTALISSTLIKRKKA